MSVQLLCFALLEQIFLYVNYNNFSFEPCPNGAWHATIYYTTRHNARAASRRITCKDIKNN